MVQDNRLSRVLKCYTEAEQKTCVALEQSYKLCPLSNAPHTAPFNAFFSIVLFCCSFEVTFPSFIRESIRMVRFQAVAILVNHGKPHKKEQPVKMR